MRRSTILLALVALLMSGTLAAQDSVKRVALTFDDAPLGDGPFMSGEARTEALIDALAAVGVEGAMFFVTTGHMERAGESGKRRIQRYVDTGHLLGNHSRDHLWLHRTPVEDYLADLDAAIASLAEFDGVMPYFRFTYLDEGRDIAKRDALRAALAERGLRNGYVTIDDYDWYMVNLAGEAIQAGHELDLDELRDAYVELLVDAANFYDDMALEYLGRSPAHVFLLHENDLAAMFIDDLVRGLRDDGWEIIPAMQAFEDPIASYEPDTMFLGQGRVAAIAHEQGATPRDLVHITEDEQRLREEFVQRGLLPGQADPDVVLPSLMANLVCHYDFDHPVVDDAAKEMDLGPSGTAINLVNGGADMRVPDAAWPRAGQALQTRQVNPAENGNDDWKAGVYDAGGVETLDAFNATAGLTLMGWVKPTGPNPGPNSTTENEDDFFGAMGLFGVLSGTSEGHLVRGLLEVMHVDGTLRLVALGRRQDAGTSLILAADGDWNSLLPDDTWTHVVATFDFDEGRATLYRNGELVPATYSATVDPWQVDGGPEPDLSSDTNPTGIKIGGSYPQNTAERNPFNGRFDDLMCFDRALSAEEVRAQYARFFN